MLWRSPSAPFWLFVLIYLWAVLPGFVGFHAVWILLIGITAIVGMVRTLCDSDTARCGVR